MTEVKHCTGQESTENWLNTEKIKIMRVNAEKEKKKTTLVTLSETYLREVILKHMKTNYKQTGENITVIQKWQTELSSNTSQMQKPLTKACVLNFNVERITGRRKDRQCPKWIRHGHELKLMITGTHTVIQQKIQRWEIWRLKFKYN